MSCDWDFPKCTLPTWRMKGDMALCICGGDAHEHTTPGITHLKEWGKTTTTELVAPLYSFLRAQCGRWGCWLMDKVCLCFSTNSTATFHWTNLDRSLTHRISNPYPGLCVRNALWKEGFVLKTTELVEATISEENKNLCFHMKGMISPSSTPSLKIRPSPWQSETSQHTSPLTQCMTQSEFLSLHDVCYWTTS